MSPDLPVLFVAPGAGLGHLVRVSAVSLALDDLGIGTRIVTNSVFGSGLGRITGLAIDHIPSTRWVKTIHEYMEFQSPALTVIDAFPWGIRGEWEKKQAPMAYLARRLNIPAYLKAAGGDWENRCPPFDLVIEVEPLTEQHRDLLGKTNPVRHRLTGPIRFPAEKFPVKVPADLDKLLSNHPTWLIVHSGPLEEVRQLRDLALKDMGGRKDGAAAAVHPYPLKDDSIPFFEYFPASRLYGRAHRIVAGAGYNSLADRAVCPEKHIVKAFPRRYDDQAGRLVNMHEGRENGAIQAARLIAENFFNLF